MDPGWWRVSEPEEEELLSFPTYVSPPAVSSATISEVIDPNLEQDNAGEGESAPPVQPAAAPGPATADAPAAADLDDMEEADEDDHAVPAVPEVLLRRSTRENRGVPPIRMQDMLMVAMEMNDDDPKTYKKAMKLSDADLGRDACVTEISSL